MEPLKQFNGANELDTADIRCKNAAFSITGRTHRAGWHIGGEYFTVMNKDYVLPLDQSISRSNLYSAIIPGEARLSGATAKSVFNSKIEETVP